MTNEDQRKRNLKDVQDYINILNNNTGELGAALIATIAQLILTTVQIANQNITSKDANGNFNMTKEEIVNTITESLRRCIMVWQQHLYENSETVQ